MRKNRIILVPLLIVFFASSSTLLSDRARERTLTLRFIPQEATGSSSPTLPEGVVTKPVEIAFEDGRPPSEIGAIGEGTDDKDRPFPWRAANSVLAFASEVFDRTAGGWGVRVQQGADLLMIIRLTRFFVTEKDQAVGSSYTADVRVAFTIKDRLGTLLADGVGSGSARRYGRKRSAENCAEVLSDAIKESYARLLDDPALQAAWTGRRSGSAPIGQAVSPSDLLAELVALKNQGLSPELLAHYVSQKVLTAPLSSQDLVHWKEAGLDESVIRTAMDRYHPVPAQ